MKYLRRRRVPTMIRVSSLSAQQTDFQAARFRQRLTGTHGSGGEAALCDVTNVSASQVLAPASKPDFLVEGPAEQEAAGG